MHLVLELERHLKHVHSRHPVHSMHPVNPLERKNGLGVKKTSVICAPKTLLAPHTPPGQKESFFDLKDIWNNECGWSERSVHPCTSCTPWKIQKVFFREINAYGWYERSVHPGTLCTPWKIQKVFSREIKHLDDLKGLCTLAPHAPLGKYKK